MKLIPVIKKNQRVQDGRWINGVKYYTGLLNSKARFYVEKHEGNNFSSLSEKLNVAAKARAAQAR
jgi:hypothetical protein